MDFNTTNCTKQQLSAITHTKFKPENSEREREKKKKKKPPKKKSMGVTKTKNGTAFTYYSPNIKKITNIFRHTKIVTAFKTTNTLQQLTKPKHESNTQELDKSSIYKLKFNTCQVAYIGQTRSNLRQRYLEHRRCIRHNNPQSAYAQKILNNRHEYGTINNTMYLLKHQQNFNVTTIRTTIHSITSTSQAAYFRTKHRRA